MMMMMMMEHEDRILQIMTSWPLWPYDRRWMYLLKAAIEEHPFFGIPFAGWDLWAFLYLSPTTWWWKTCYDKVWFATASMKKRIPHSTIYFHWGYIISYVWTILTCTKFHGQHANRQVHMRDLLRWGHWRTIAMAVWNLWNPWTLFSFPVVISSGKLDG